MRRSSFESGLVALAIVVASASAAVAHCCHDDRMLGVAAQSGLRPGLHGLGEGLTDESIQADGPTIDESMDTRDDSSFGSGTRYGQMHGNSLGNYGAGSLGERGPGGLGAMQNGGIGGPVHPR